MGLDEWDLYCLLFTHLVCISAHKGIHQQLCHPTVNRLAPSNKRQDLAQRLMVEVFLPDVY